MVEWKSASTIPMAPSVTHSGESSIQAWSVENLDLLSQVSGDTTRHMSEYSIIPAPTAAVPQRGLMHGDDAHIVLDNVDCVGNELDLLDCSHDGINEHNCLPLEHSAAGVLCTGKEFEPAGPMRCLCTCFRVLQ